MTGSCWLCARKCTGSTNPARSAAYSYMGKATFFNYWGGGEQATLQQMLICIQRDVRHHELTPLLPYSCPKRCLEATYISCCAPSSTTRAQDGFLPLDRVLTHCYREGFTYLPALQTVHMFAHQLLEATAPPVWS